MKTFEITCPVGRMPREDKIREMAAEVLHLRRNSVINVVDPTKSYQSMMMRPDAVCRIAHRSIDARGDVKMVYRIEAYYAREYQGEYELPELKDVHEGSLGDVIVVGCGPAGMFAALKLLSLGFRPIVLERGKDVHGRKKDIAAASREGIVNPESNYCYGEGGAGTFSDGKLLTRSSKRGDVREILYRFVQMGADPAILIDAHPHLGTDKLPRLVENIRKTIEQMGGEYHFSTRVDDIVKLKNGSFNVKCTDTSSEKMPKKTFKASAVILAMGHSAKDMYMMLQEKGAELQPKGFALGVRVEHPQSLINKIRYRGQWEEGMPAAEYSFVENVVLEEDLPEESEEEMNAEPIEEDAPVEQENAKEIGRGVYSFCMCPGGILVPTPTSDGETVLNGMSNSARNSRWANAGVVVQIEPGDEGEGYGDGPFSLLDFQHDVEKTMNDFIAEKRKEDPSINPLAAPAQRMLDFCNGVVSQTLPETSYKPGVVSAPLHSLLPSFVARRLASAFEQVSRHGMKQYFTNEALLLGVESRTSSPVRVVRDPDTFCCTTIPGLFPCGEGAGYAGGIVTSAIDGINCALAAKRYLCPEPEPEENTPSDEEGESQE